MWGLNYTNSQIFGSEIFFTPFESPLLYNIPIFFSGIIPTILILFSSIKLIIMANRLRAGKDYIKDIENKVIKWGAISILSPIIYMIALNITINILYAIDDYPPIFVLFGTRNPGFAFIGPFIGGSLVLISGIVSKTKISSEFGITTMYSQPITQHTSNYTKVIWIVALTGGVIALISLLTPSFYADEASNKQYYWLWGLFYGYIEDYGSNFGFLLTQSPSVYTMPMFFSGLLSAILTLTGSIRIITITNDIRRGREELKFVEKEIIGWGIALIVSPIFFVIAISVSMSFFFSYLYPMLPSYSIPGMWDVYQPGFAIFGPVIGAILVIISGIACKMIQPKKTYTISSPYATSKPIPQVQITEKAAHVKFCPDCGKELLHKQDRFCSNCGFEINIVM